MGVQLVMVYDVVDAFAAVGLIDDGSVKGTVDRTRSSAPLIPE
jgi:hypothetical protein